MYLPCDSIQKSNQTGFRNTTFEERVCCQGTKSIVANLSIGGRSSTMDQGEIFVRGQGRNVKEG